MVNSHIRHGGSSRLSSQRWRALLLALSLGGCLLFVNITAPVQAEEYISDPTQTGMPLQKDIPQTDDAFTWEAAGEQVWSVRDETVALFAGITLVSLRNWDWGSSKEFRFNNVEWFGEATGSGGADKFGHAFASYEPVNSFLKHPFCRKTRSPANNLFTPRRVNTVPGSPRINCEAISAI